MSSEVFKRSVTLPREGERLDALPVDFAEMIDSRTFLGGFYRSEQHKYFYRAIFFADQDYA